MPDIMHVKNKEPLQIKIQELRAENRALSKKIASYKKEIKKQQESIKKRDLLLHSLPAGIILIQKGKMIDINDTMLTEFERGYEEVMGRDFLDFVHPEQRAYAQTFLALWNSGRNGPEHMDVFLVKQDGRPMLFEMRIEPVRVHNKRALLLHLTTLGKRKELEEARVRSKKMKALITMASGLKEQIRMHTGTLMAGISGLKEGAGRKQAESYHALKALENSSQELFSIAHKLEVLAGMHDPQHENVSFDLNECVQEAVSCSVTKRTSGPENQAGNIGLRTYLRSASLITGDPGGIREVIVHLIHNAMESMPEGGEVLITTEDSAGSAHVYIQDSGTGIPEDHRERIYDPFFTTGGNGSKGLGLSLSYAIVKRHKGDIEISGREGHGTMVHIVLPVARPGDGSDRRTGKTRIEEAQILIIQEEDVPRELLSHMLCSRGSKVETAADGIEGLGRLKRREFDLMIADTGALHLESDLFVKRCRDLHPNLSIVLITRDGQSPDPDGNSMADLKIRKPVVMNRLLKQVTELLADG